MARNSNIGSIVITLAVIGVIGFFIYSVFIEDASSPQTGTGSTYGDPYSAAADETSRWPGSIDTAGVEPEDDFLMKNYYLILDGSGSMNGEKMDVAKEALIRFIAQVPDNANIGLLVFDETGLSERSGLGDSRQRILEEIRQVRASGYTPLRSALEIAFDKITRQGARQFGYGEYNIVVVTDGEASDGEEPDRIVNTILGTSPVVIHTIGFQIGPHHSLNQPGRIYYKQADNFTELSKGLEEVLAELESFSVMKFE
ncbi:MAG: VWA domain-containing protein [Spirochaetales bacterium]|nr:VWA domain-containing protein [Spirochaetales bacterium]